MTVRVAEPWMPAERDAKTAALVMPRSVRVWGSVELERRLVVWPQRRILRVAVQHAVADHEAVHLGAHEALERVDGRTHGSLSSQSN